MSVLFFRILFLIAVFLNFVSCGQQTDKQHTKASENISSSAPIIDCNYSFDEAIAGTKAPDYVVKQLELITVHYYAMDGKIHRGQLLTNKLIANDLREVFKDMLQLKFPVAKVIPIVKYNWDDQASMHANNTYSFCYRDISYSKHALGLAIDINPMQNPNRWKPEFSYRKNVPEGAVYNPQVPGTFHHNHPIVEIFRNKGFFWGHYFRRNHDDHHFEKKVYN